MRKIDLLKFNDPLALVTKWSTTSNDVFVLDLHNYDLIEKDANCLQYELISENKLSILKKDNHKALIFDKQKGAFCKVLWKGNSSSEIMITDAKNIKLNLPLARIHAIQLIFVFFSEFPDDYQINLVLDDGERINLMTFQDANRARLDANKIATFLGIPVWDAINHKTSPIILEWPVGRSGWAIASGYLGVLSIFIIPAPAALFCGIMALHDISKNPFKLGKFRAYLGIIAGSIGTIIILFFFSYIITLFFK
jgi:hypothetical protein